MTRIHPFTADELLYLIHHIGWWEIEEDCPPVLREQILEKIAREGMRTAPDPYNEVLLIE